MTEAVPAAERSPKGDHNRRIAMGFDLDQFAQAAGVTSQALHKYETTPPDGEFDLETARLVGLALDRLDGSTPNPADGSGPAAAVSAPAFAAGRTTAPLGISTQVRPAGPDAMRDPPGQWEDTDEAADESFPASDPPASHRVD